MYNTYIYMYIYRYIYNKCLYIHAPYICAYACAYTYMYTCEYVYRPVCRLQALIQITGLFLQNIVSFIGLFCNRNMYIDQYSDCRPSTRSSITKHSKKSTRLGGLSLLYSSATCVCAFTVSDLGFGV